MNWTDHAVSGLFASAVTYGHGTYVSIDNLKFRRSSDGIGWDPVVQQSGSATTFLWVTFGPTGN